MSGSGWVQDEGGCLSCARPFEVDMESDVTEGAAIATVCRLEE